jgi:PAS domain S-box-containing protein
MDKKLLELLERTRAAVTIKDDAGYCVYANESAAALRGLKPSDLIGRHVTEMAGSDARLVEKELERLREDGAWVGQYPTRTASGELVFQRAYNFVRRDWDGTYCFVSFAYPRTSLNVLDRDGPARRVRPPLTAMDICIAQLFVDGYDDEEVSTILGLPHQDVSDLVGSLVRDIEASSKTEACVRALKTRLVV